jgi:hypothetical protein
MEEGYLRPFSERSRRARDCRDFASRRSYDFAMPVRIYPLSPLQWKRLAASRYDACDRHLIDLVDLGAETDPGRRMRSEHARIQAYLDALAPQGAH